eukprot:g421.t1
MLAGFKVDVSHQEQERILSEVEAWYLCAKEQAGVEWLPLEGIKNFLFMDLGYEDEAEFEDAIHGSFEDSLDMEGKPQLRISLPDTPPRPRKLTLTVNSSQQLLDTTLLKDGTLGSRSDRHRKECELSWSRLVALGACGLAGQILWSHYGILNSVISLPGGKGHSKHKRLRGKLLRCLGPQYVLSLAKEMESYIRATLEDLAEETSTKGFGTFEPAAGHLAQKISILPILAGLEDRFGRFCLGADGAARGCGGF